MISNLKYTFGETVFSDWAANVLGNSIATANATVKLGYPNYNVVGFADTSDDLPDNPTIHDCHIAVEPGTVFGKTCVEQSILHYTGTEWEVLAYRYDQIYYLLMGTGDMTRAVYDPNTIAGDAFDMDNMLEGATNLILTVAERAAIADAATETWVNANFDTFPGFTSLLADYGFTDNSTNWDTAFSWGDHAGLYLTSETDPVFTAWDKSTGIEISESQITDLGNYITGITAESIGSLSDVDLTGWAENKILKFDATGNLIVATDESGTGGGIALTDLDATSPLAYNSTTGVFSLASGYTIPTDTEKGNYDTAYGWGDHAGLYLASYTETDPVFTAWDKSTGISITESQITDLGNYLTGITAESIADLSDVDLTGWAQTKILEFDADGNLVVGVKTSGSGIALTDLSASTPLAYNNVSGDFSVASGYTIPTDTEKGNYDTAYGWGDHAGLYLTSYTETDPVFTAWDKSTGISITESQITDLGNYALSTIDLEDILSNGYTSTYGATFGDDVKISNASGHNMLYMNRPTTGQLNYIRFQTGGANKWDFGQLYGPEDLQVYNYNINDYPIVISNADGNVKFYNATTAVKYQLNDANTYIYEDSSEIHFYDTVNGIVSLSDLIGGGSETDPVFTAWDKSTGISITESQISDFGTYLTASDIADMATETWVTGQSYLTAVPDSSVSYSKIADEFKGVQALSALDVDWSTNAVFSKTVTSDPTFTFSNLRVATKILKITGDYSPTFPTGFIYAGGARSATGVTRYVVTCDDPTTPSGFYSILKDES